MPNSTGHFLLMLDTSKVGCGAAFDQNQKCKYHLVAYCSKRLPEAVANYSISELELTGVMTNVVAFKHLLKNAHFHLYCDHSFISVFKVVQLTQHLLTLLTNLQGYYLWNCFRFKIV